MEKSPAIRLELEETGSQVCTDLQSEPPRPEPPATQEVMSGCGRGGFEAERQNKQSPDEPLLIHGLSVQRYREIYNSVLPPSVLAALSSSKQADYVSQVLELKQRLWTQLSRPRLVETLREDGRVEVMEIFDLT